MSTTRNLPQDLSILFIFIDGLGIGSTDPLVNPLIRAHLPTISDLLGGHSLASSTQVPLITRHTTLLALDAVLGVEGLPQSATGQASLLTGKNIPSLLQCHYGPKPNKDIKEHLQNGNIFSQIKGASKSSVFLNAFPPRYFESMNQGIRIPGTIAMAANKAGIPLLTATDLINGNAISADLTGNGWKDQLGIHDIPPITYQMAGERLARLSQSHHFSMFEYWLSDIVGHRQDMKLACGLLEAFDQTLNALLQAWDNESGLIIITSDHGNLEALDTRHHTIHPVPLLIIGDQEYRRLFLEFLLDDHTILPDLTRVAPAILRMLGIKASKMN